MKIVLALLALVASASAFVPTARPFRTMQMSVQTVSFSAFQFFGRQRKREGLVRVVEPLRIRTREAPSILFL